VASGDADLLIDFHATERLFLGCPVDQPEAGSIGHDIVQDPTDRDPSGGRGGTMLMPGIDVLGFSALAQRAGIVEYQFPAVDEPGGVDHDVTPNTFIAVTPVEEYPVEFRRQPLNCSATQLIDEDEPLVGKMGIRTKCVDTVI
jgi:hypothetical protein